MPHPPRPNVLGPHARLGVATFLGISGLAVPTVLLIVTCHTTNQAWFRLDAAHAETVRALLVSQVALAALAVVFGYALLGAALRLVGERVGGAPWPEGQPEPADVPATPQVDVGF